MKIGFSSASIMALFRTEQGAEKLFKFPFEAVEYVSAGCPGADDYPNRALVLGKSLWECLIPHTLLHGRRDELTLSFSATSGLLVESKEESNFSSTTYCQASDFHTLSITARAGASFTLIRSEVLALAEAAASSDSLLKFHFGLDSAPVLVESMSGSRGLGSKFIMSTMMSDHGEPGSRDFLAESDPEPADIDDTFGIPMTPEYVY